MWLFTAEISIGRDITFGKYRVEAEYKGTDGYGDYHIKECPENLCIRHLGLLPGQVVGTLQGAAVLMAEDDGKRAAGLISEWFSSEARHLAAQADEYAAAADVTAFCRPRFIDRTEPGRA